MFERKRTYTYYVDSRLAVALATDDRYGRLEDCRR